VDLHPQKRFARPGAAFCSAIRDEKGVVIGFLGIARDLTERKKEEAQRERFFSLSLDMLGIAGTDGYSNG